MSSNTPKTGLLSPAQAYIDRGDLVPIRQRSDLSGLPLLYYDAGDGGFEAADQLFAMNNDGIVTDAAIEYGDASGKSIFARNFPDVTKMGRIFKGTMELLVQQIEKGEISLFRGKPELDEDAQKALYAKIIEDIKAQAEAASTPKETT